MTDQTETEPYRFTDADDFCLSARLLPDLDNGGVTDTLSITIEGSDEPQSVHVQAADVPAVAAGILRAAGEQFAADHTALLRRAASYLSALHGSVARHDNLAANYGCAGCQLRDQIGVALAGGEPIPPDESEDLGGYAQPDPPIRCARLVPEEPAAEERPS
ncbi:hypothetical protein [Streptomyces sp. NPDC006285]|uniref:hypothetical protein n=1 Tax=Streptomyces sp. NPDC006285 TaxID=3364742 RepID=UPI003698E09A